MKLLTIGNSFTDSLAKYLPALFDYEHIPFRFDRANFGGCELRRHWSYIAAEEANPDCRIYCGGRKLRDILGGTLIPRAGEGERHGYDFISIQQASHESWRGETFQPYADKILAFIAANAPTAEVVIQQTWAYRADCPRLDEWHISQAEMHRKLTENYFNLAAEKHLRVIPTGDAVAWARAHEKHPFKPYDPALPETLRWPDLPPQASDVVGGISWIKNHATGRLELHRDLIHLNVRGQYLQACLWFGVLMKRNPETIAFVPDEIDDADAAFLRKAAAEALRQRSILH